jgi:hypothetical protein
LYLIFNLINAFVGFPFEYVEQRGKKPVRISFIKRPQNKRQLSDSKVPRVREQIPYKYVKYGLNHYFLQVQLTLNNSNITIQTF